jgi:hypothetical protein
MGCPFVVVGRGCSSSLVTGPYQPAQGEMPTSAALGTALYLATSALAAGIPVVPR